MTHSSSADAPHSATKVINGAESLTLINSNQFTFTEPGGAVAGPSYVQALNPPFVPFTSSGNGSGGAFTLH